MKLRGQKIRRQDAMLRFVRAGLALVEWVVDGSAIVTIPRGGAVQSALEAAGMDREKVKQVLVDAIPRAIFKEVAFVVPGKGEVPQVPRGKVGYGWRGGDHPYWLGRD